MVNLNKEDIKAIERIKNNPVLADSLKSKMISDILNHRCPDCNSALEEEDVYYDNNDMTEGQEADWEAGFGRNFYCPKCKTVSQRDVEVFDDFDDEEYTPTPRQLEALKNGRRNQWSDKRIKGYIGESWFANKLRNEGFKVRNTMLFDYEMGVSVFNQKGVADLLKDYSKQKTLMKLLASFEKGYPDLICLKDDKVSFYEVKTNNSKPKPHQEEVIKVLRSKGYEVELTFLDVEYSVEKRDQKE